MKLLSLNIWGGREYFELIDFLEKIIPEIDIYCFQEVFDSKDSISYSHEVRADIWQKLKDLFLDYHRFYYPSMSGWDDKGSVPYDLSTGLGMFIKRDIEVSGEGDFFTYRRRFAPIKLDTKDQPVNLQYAHLGEGGGKVHVYNFHGIWYPGDKLDTPERIEQSEKLAEFINGQEGIRILCGDFNLMPETESVSILETNFKNLIKDFNIRTTRSILNPYRGSPFEQAFADYVFVSKEVKVVNFKVPDVAISDHLPMILEFKI